MRLRIGFIVATGRKLRVCLVVRFSTDEQKKRRRSNESQVKFLKKELETEFKRLGITAYEYTVISDEAVSGEVCDRPGIFELRKGIDRRAWDVIVCEDSSRLYRSYAFCHRLVAAAYDNRIRVICIGDDVDTAEEGWESRLAEAQAHHAKDNAYTRRRLARAIADLWELGAAVGPLRSGHLRKAEDKDAPSFDSLHPIHYKHILCAFRIVVFRKNPKTAAEYLTRRKVPKRDGQVKPWNVRNVIALIRNSIYRGVEFYRLTRAEQKKTTGVTVQRENQDSASIWRREMPHLRIVSDGLWYRANEVIDARTKGPHPPKGENNAQFGIPRNSRTPMSEIKDCGICEGKMYAVGSSYRCRSVHRKLPALGDGQCCWNHATASRRLTHERIYERVVTEIVKSEEHLGVLADYLAEMCADETDWRTEERKLEQDIKRLRKECEKWGDAIAKADIAPKSLVQRIATNEADVERKEAELADVRQELSSRPEIPNREVLVAALHEVAGKLGEADRGARDLLKELLEEKILDFPYRLLDSDRIVLRAHFTLNLIGLCPQELRERLRLKLPVEKDREVLRVPCVVDLFETAQYVTIACEAADPRNAATFRDIVAKHGGKGATVKKAKRLAKSMIEQGITDPFIRLEAPPESGSRWHLFNKTAS